MFFTVVFSGILLMSAYVGWRAGSVPTVRRILPWWARAVLLVALGSAFLLARFADEENLVSIARVLEFAGAYWIGILLLLSVAMLAADLVTGFGLLFRRRLPVVRGWALVVGFALALTAVVQGHRAPVVREYDVHLSELPARLDGTRLLFLSDLHLGSLLGRDWLAARLAQVAALRPDAIVLGGDILEGDSPTEADLLPMLRRLSAPLGVWAVPGNHEYHGGGSTLTGMANMGIHVLRNEWREAAPGLVFAGVDRGTRRRDDDDVPPAADGRPAGASPLLGRLRKALDGRPEGATILVSHAPALVADAARLGAGLMLSGHTHDGQIWPFRYFVRLETPYLAGRYDVGGMPLIVCRGTGTFGPRMRLWYPSEMLMITLRAR